MFSSKPKASLARHNSSLFPVAFLSSLMMIALLMLGVLEAQGQNNITAGTQPSTIPGHLPGNLLNSIPACQQGVRLNRWNFIAYHGYVPDRAITPQEKAGTESRLKELKDEYVAACAADGNEMMAATRTRMEDEHNHQMAGWDDFWGAWARRWVTDIHNGHLAEMTKWYQEGIRSCQQHFTVEFNALRGQLCP